jgi:hypothetical protein
LACVDRCNPRDVQCRRGCIERVGRASRRSMTTLNQCMQQNNCRDLQCAARSCADELRACQADQ